MKVTLPLYIVRYTKKLMDYLAEVSRRWKKGHIEVLKIGK